MTGVIIFRGAAHIIEYQNALALLLMGTLVGLPAREAFCNEGQYVPYFEILDDVYVTGIEMSVETMCGVLWFVRLADGSGVGACYQREPSLPLPERPPEPFLLVPVG
jgi:hypothetical protein